jgi:hypothetical protein
MHGADLSAAQHHVFRAALAFQHAGSALEVVQPMIGTV